MQRAVPPVSLPVWHPTAVAFLDETGSISRDRFFAVGCLILPEPSVVLRAVQKLRDIHHWYAEMKWVEVTETSYPLYRDVLEVLCRADIRYACFVADRESADPVARFGDAWLAYEKLAAQLLIGAVRPGELVSVLADNYSTPDRIVFEVDVRRDVNERLGKLVLVSVCRLDSRSSDGLQLVDLLTGAVTFEYRQAAGLAGSCSAKAKLAKDLRGFLGVPSVIGRTRTSKLNVAVYRPGWSLRLSSVDQPALDGRRARADSCLAGEGLRPLARFLCHSVPRTRVAALGTTDPAREYLSRRAHECAIDPGGEHHLRCGNRRFKASRPDHLPVFQGQSAAPRQGRGGPHAR